MASLYNDPSCTTLRGRVGARSPGRGWAAKLLTLGLFLCLATPARSATTAESYLAERDQAIASLRPADGKEPAAGDSDREKAALAKLQTMMRDLVGPIKLPGFQPAGTYTLDTLSAGDMGFGRLDGLNVQSRDGKTRGIVTTEQVTLAWLRTAGAGEDKSTALPTSLDAAFALEDFYTKAMSDEAAASAYGELPAGLPAGQGPARVLMVRFGQDYVSPNPPDELIVAAAGNGLVAILWENIGVRVGQIPACKTAYDGAMKAADAVFKQYQASKAKDGALFDKYTAMQSDADAGYRRCFATAIKSRPEYPALVKQAQALAARAATR